MHLVKKNNNGRAAGVNTGFASIDEEFAALEDLGPKCRHALTAGPMPVLASKIVEQIIDYNDQVEAENEQLAAQGLQPRRRYLDPKDPQLDEALAKGVLQCHLETMLKDGISDLERATSGMKPLIGKRSPKSAREQAKAERLARRYMRR